MGLLCGDIEKQVPNAVQVTGSVKMNSRNVSKELKCNMFGRQKRVKKVVSDKYVFND